MIKHKFEQFHVIPYTNPSGRVVHRVYGRLDDKLIRENYQLLPVALARKQELEIQAINAPLVLTMQPTRLTVEELRDAESALRRLKGGPHSLLFAVDYLLRNYRDDLVRKTLADAYDEFIAEKRAHGLRPRSILDLQMRIGAMKEQWGKRPVREITATEVKSLLYHGTRAPQTILNHRRTMYTFFEWCARQNYAPANIVAKIDAPTVQHGEPEALSVADVRALLKAALDHKEGVLVPYLALGLFTGLRAAELRRIDWSDLDLENRILTVSSEVAKLRSRRIIELTDNTVSWLSPYRANPIVPPNWRKDADAVRRAAGFKGSFPKKCDKNLKIWPVNVLRHTAISFWQGKFKDEGGCADRHGNSVDIIHKHYRCLVRPQDAEIFWSLTPDNINAERQIIPMQAVAA